jgi:hypothetical protein
MTKFNPEGGFKDIEIWESIAEKKAGQTGAASKFIEGILVGGLGVSMGAEILGGVIAAWLIKSAWDALSNAGMRLKLVRDMGCNAFVLGGSDFKTYIKQFGEEAVYKELIHADSHDCELSSDAANWLRDYTKSINPASTISRQKVSVSQPELQTIASNLGESTYQKDASSVDIYDPYLNSKIDIISEIIDPLSNLFIVGLGGSGKDMLLSNALREVKRLYPNKKIFIINGKDDPKERGYFDGIVDKNNHKVLHCETAKPQTVAAWFEACVIEFDQFAAANNGALLVIDEGTIIGSRLKAAKSTALGDKLIGISSCGGSSGKNIWFLAQTPYVGANGSDKSAIGQLTPIVIVNKSNLAVLEAWKQASLFKRFDTDEIAELIEQSECERAVYFGKTAQWYSMPSLTNYSGYNRDKGEYLPGFIPQDCNPTKLENSLNLEPDTVDNSDIELNTLLSDSAQLVLDWLIKNRFKQWVKFRGKEGRDMSFIKLLSEKGIDAEARDKVIQELVIAEKVDLTSDGDYMKLV